MTALLSIRSIEKRFEPEGPPVVARISVEVAAGEIVALLGPSGCGKTTTLRLVAGFERLDAGEIRLWERTISGPGVHVPPERRGIGLVFQDYALFPHLSVLENIAFGLRGLDRETRTRRVERALELLGLGALRHRMPHSLSGGQQQRVAVARTMATAPDLILMDEPFSNLDALRRQTTRQEIREILKSTGTTTILVTHDQEEALSFADRVGVIRDGRLEQIGAPEKVYHEPRTLFVAQFLGRTNLLTCQADGRFADTPLGRVRLNRDASGDVLIALRPEHVTLDRPTGPDPPAVVLDREFRGHDVTYRVELNGLEILAHLHSREIFHPGDRVSVRATEPAVVLEKPTDPPQ